MIAVVKGCHAVLAALLFLLPAAEAADDLTSAARELARKTTVYGKVDRSAIVWRNLSSLGSADLTRARTAFEAALQEAGMRNGSAPVLSVRVTLSQNPTQFLLVEEAQAGDERQVWIAGWKRAAARNALPGLSLESKLVWEQDEQILDVAFAGDALLVLSPSKLTLNARGESQSAPLTPAKPWPRDLRGHLRVAGDTLQAFLPGMVCAGSAKPSFHLDCRNSDEPWVLEAGSRAILLANFGGRNFFDGRVVTQAGARKNIAPFYSAAALEEQGRTVWVAALTDGRAQILDAALDAQSSFAAWGSDLAGVDTRCGAGSAILASRPGDGSEPDAVQGFTLSGGTPVPVTAPITFAGPVTALWPSGSNAAMAVARDLATGKYEAYAVRVACGE